MTTTHRPTTREIGNVETAARFEVARLDREITAAEAWLRDNANSLPCGAQDAAYDEIAALRAERDAALETAGGRR